MALARFASAHATAAATAPAATGRTLRVQATTKPAMSTTTMTMPAGRNRCESGVSTDATAGGTSLRIRNRLTSQPVAPALSTTAAAANRTAPSPARSPAAQALGTRAGRFGHHHAVMAGHVDFHSASELPPVTPLPGVASDGFLLHRAAPEPGPVLPALGRLSPPARRPWRRSPPHSH